MKFVVFFGNFSVFSCTRESSVTFTNSFIDTCSLQCHCLSVSNFASSGIVTKTETMLE